MLEVKSGCGILEVIDGYTSKGFTVPSLKAQLTLLQSVYSQAGIDPTKVQYVGSAREPRWVILSEPEL